MERRDYVLLDRLQMIRGFVVEYPGMPSEVINSGVMEQLNQLIDDISAYGSTHEHMKGKRVAGDLKAIREQLLTQHLNPIIEMANLAEGMHDVRAIKRPGPRDHGAKFVAQMSSMITTVQPHAEYFVRMGLRPSFLTEMAELIAAYDAVHLAGRAAISTRAGATTGVKLGVERSRKVVKALHGLLKHHSPPSSEFGARWDQMKKFPRHGSLPAPMDKPALPPGQGPLALPAPTDPSPTDPSPHTDQM